MFSEGYCVNDTSIMLVHLLEPAYSWWSLCVLYLLDIQTRLDAGYVNLGALIPSLGMLSSASGKNAKISIHVLRAFL
mgnify:CR=1 FL=1